MQKEGKNTGELNIKMQIDKKLEKRSPWTAHQASNLRSLSDGRALQLHALSECDTRQPKELATNSMYNYACCRLRLLTHPSGPAELLGLPWVVSTPIADARCVQHVVTC